jgi:isoleucyl-tRNA synthetase
MPEVTATKPENNQATTETKPLKSTLNLPQTAFAMKANLPVNEPIRLAAWQQQDLYAQIRAARVGAPRYILHDGPPYANGAIHLGHALNKCIKDFVVKTKTMAGFDSPYVPGWDCHGLPIEIKVDEQLGRKKLEMPPLAVRKACREYAQKYVDLQRSQFERIGVFGRWNNPYLTMSLPYEASIVETFYDFFEKGFVYKGLKPVYWCWHDKTALAEAEIEYEMHTSPSIYVRYKLTSDPAAIAAELCYFSESDASPEGSGSDTPQPAVYTIIWTTTPWTLPASLAVAFNPELDYVALRNTDGNVYIVAEALEEATKAACNLPDAIEIARFKGTRLDRSTFHHPFLDREILGVNADYVTTEQGTGAVHTAPSHGVDDFITGTRYGLSQLCDVDAAGRIRNGLPEYDGLQIFKANPVIIDLVASRGALMGRSDINHSYPHCWRCHNPVIFRATEQWFISMETPMTAPDGSPTTFRQRTLDEISTVKWDPSWGQERISNMIATRPDWTISRQRIWGVPIAVFMCEKCHTPLNDPAINKSIVELFHKEGADAWYAHDVASLLPAGTTCGSCASTDFRKEMDILDVWFESGSSWHAVLDIEPELQWPADLYTEGGDQHRGWFHSSILTSVAVRGKAPYKMVATSGWTLDEQGRAFSKSLGNGVDPVDIAKRLGGEIVRLWVASVDFREDVAASENLMQRVSDNYRKLRNTFRFLLGNLHDFDPSTDAQRDFAKLEPLDQYILARLAELDKKIRKAYDDFEFHRAYHALNEFINTDLSALYLDVLKDRLYTFAPNHPARRSAQTAMGHIAETLTRLVAPILSFTAEEVWQSLPKAEAREASVHLALFPELSTIIPSNTRDLLDDWQRLLETRDRVLTGLENLRANKIIGKALEAEVRIDSSSPLLHKYSTALPELFNVSQVEVVPSSTSGDEIFNISKSEAPKCERCWRYVPDVGNEAKYPTVCLRCAEALDAIGYPPYAASGSAE